MSLQLTNLLYANSLIKKQAFDILITNTYLKLVLSNLPFTKHDVTLDSRTYHS